MVSSGRWPAASSLWAVLSGMLPGARLCSFLGRFSCRFASAAGGYLGSLVFGGLFALNGSASGVRVVLGIRPGLHPGARLRGSVSGPCFSLYPPRRWPLSGPRLYVILSIAVPPLGALWRRRPSIILSVGSCRFSVGCWGAHGCGVGRAWFCGPHTSKL